MFRAANDQQKEAICYIDTPLLVLAGAGSGKTRVITEKIVHLIQSHHIPAQNIVAVTFTNKAAREMQSRVKKLIKGKQAKGLTVSTFHSLGLTIIRREYKTLGYKSGLSIFDAHDTKSLLTELMRLHADDYLDRLDLVQHTISNWKNNMLNPEQAMIGAMDDDQKRMAHIYLEYSRILQAYNAVDFDDLIYLPVILFKKCPHILDYWQNKVRYLLVDEYQDTNEAQYIFIRMLVQLSGQVTVVGDDDQSIYAWRGANPENILRLSQDYCGLKVIKLEQNYRSTQLILKAANHLISHNTHLFEKSLWSDLGLGDPIRVIKCKNDIAECERIAVEILTHRLRMGNHYKDYAVLYRSNFQSRLLEIKLQQHHIPYHINGGISFFSRVEVKDMMAYLRLLINPDDDNAFLRIINIPRREIGPATLEKLGNYARRCQRSLYQCCRDLGLTTCLNKKVTQRLYAFVDWLDRTSRDIIASSNPKESIIKMIEDIDYVAWLYEDSKSAAAAKKRHNNILFLFESLNNIVLSRTDNKENNARGKSVIEDAIARLVLRDMLEQKKDESDIDRVQLFTLHAAKGLEYSHVFMMGVEEGILPHRTNIEEDNIEEERRLAYVGITRAKKTLTMTLTSERLQYGDMVETSISRFIKELPQEGIIYSGFGEQVAPGQTKMTGRQGLAALYSAIDCE